MGAPVSLPCIAYAKPSKAPLSRPRGCNDGLAAAAKRSLGRPSFWTMLLAHAMSEAMFPGLGARRTKHWIPG
eukprot:5835358-Pyramimonas_sp.AAC.1